MFITKVKPQKNLWTSKIWNLLFFYFLRFENALSSFIGLFSDDVLYLLSLYELWWQLWPLV